MSSAEGISLGQLLIVEYERLKDEQKARIGFRDNLLYVTFASVVAVAVSATRYTNGTLLLVLPLMTLVLGWTYLANDEKISAIGDYLRTELAPRLATLSEPGAPVFGWETAHRRDPRRAGRKRMQLAVDLTTFWLTPLIAIVGYWTVGPTNPWLVTVSLAETAGVTTLAVYIAREVDLRAAGQQP